MKCRIVVDEFHEEEVVIYVHERNEQSAEIEEFVLGHPSNLLGYSDKNIINLDASEIECFLSEGGKVYALRGNEKIQIKQRLYVLEEMLGVTFIKINQSCIANIKKIERFDTSFSGALTVIFKNGYRDYVSRRQLRSVKERLGF